MEVKPYPRATASLPYYLFGALDFQKNVPGHGVLTRAMLEANAAPRSLQFSPRTSTMGWMTEVPQAEIRVEAKEDSSLQQTTTMSGKVTELDRFPRLKPPLCAAMQDSQNLLPKKSLHLGRDLQFDSKEKENV